MKYGHLKEQAVKEIPERIAFPESAMEELEKELKRHGYKLENPGN